MTQSLTLAQLAELHQRPRWSFDGFGINDRHAEYCDRIATAPTQGTHGRLELVAHQANHADALAYALDVISANPNDPRAHGVALAALRAYRQEIAR